MSIPLFPALLGPNIRIFISLGAIYKVLYNLNIFNTLFHLILMVCCNSLKTLVTQKFKLILVNFRVGITCKKNNWELPQNNYFCRFIFIYFLTFCIFFFFLIYLKIYNLLIFFKAKANPRQWPQLFDTDPANPLPSFTNRYS